MVKTIIAIIISMIFLSASALAADACTVGLTKNITGANPTYTATSSTATTGIKYYFTFNKPGTVSIIFTDSNNHRMNYSKTACPTNVGGTTSLSFAITAADLDFNFIVFRAAGSAKNYTYQITFTPDPNSEINGEGLTGEYYNKTNAANSYNAYPIAGLPTLSRLDNMVDFSWGNASPAPGIINTEYFEAKWTGFVYIPADGVWSIYTQTDDGVRLTFNNQLVINNWSDHSSTENTSGNLNLTKGYYPINMQFYEKTGQAVAGLKWSGPSFVKLPIPQGYLYQSIPVTETNENFTFLMRDSFRTIDDQNISTKIVNKTFSILLTSMDKATGAQRDFTGTACIRAINEAGSALTGWTKAIFSTEQEKSVSVLVDRAIGASDSAALQAIWQRDANPAIDCAALTETNTTVSKDRFAVRPKNFAPSPINSVAGDSFNVQVQAGDENGNPSNGYNEVNGATFLLAAEEVKAGCLTGAFSMPISTFIFTNGNGSIATSYDEVGELDLNISDVEMPCSSVFAKMDCDDKEIPGFYSQSSDLKIGAYSSKIMTKPHHFEIDGKILNGGGAFTYLSQDLNMSAAVDFNVTSKNSAGSTTKNYRGECYAKETTASLAHSAVPQKLSKILFLDMTNEIKNEIATSQPITAVLLPEKFEDGIAQETIKVNFNRQDGTPVSPFDFNITSLYAEDASLTSGSGTIDGGSVFVYGRVKGYDISSDTDYTPAPIEFELYDNSKTEYTQNMPQNTLGWFRNIKHDTTGAGQVLKGGFSQGVVDAGVQTASAPYNGLQTITIDAASDQTVHLDIPTWLWYSSKALTYSFGSTCLFHPCFSYKKMITDLTPEQEAVAGVASGKFSGSDFKMEQAKTIVKKGVKIFR